MTPGKCRRAVFTSSSSRPSRSRAHRSYEFEPSPSSSTTGSAPAEGPLDRRRVGGMSTTDVTPPAETDEAEVERARTSEPALATGAVLTRRASSPPGPLDRGDAAPSDTPVGGSSRGGDTSSGRLVFAFRFRAPRLDIYP